MRNNWGGDRVSYLDAKGRLRTLPVEWTDIQGPDPVITIGAGRAFFRADLLRQLRKAIDEQLSRNGRAAMLSKLCAICLLKYVHDRHFGTGGRSSAK